MEEVVSPATLAVVIVCTLIAGFSAGYVTRGIVLRRRHDRRIQRHRHIMHLFPETGSDIRPVSPSVPPSGPTPP